MTMRIVASLVSLHIFKFCTHVFRFKFSNFFSPQKSKDEQSTFNDGITASQLVSLSQSNAGDPFTPALKKTDGYQVLKLQSLVYLQRERDRERNSGMKDDLEAAKGQSCISLTQHPFLLPVLFF